MRLMYQKRTADIQLLILHLIIRCTLWSEKHGTVILFVKQQILYQPIADGSAPGDNRILIAGYRPAQEFVIERRLCAHQFGNSN